MSKLFLIIAFSAIAFMGCPKGPANEVPVETQDTIIVVDTVAVDSVE